MTRPAWNLDAESLTYYEVQSSATSTRYIRQGRRLCQETLEKSAIPCGAILEPMEERVSSQPELQTEVGLYKKEPADRRHCDHVQ